MAPSAPVRLHVALRMCIDVSLALHLAAAAGYWWLSPKGFPLESSRFWLNSVLPIVLIFIALAGLVAVHRGHWPAASAAVLFFAVAWLAGAIVARMLFPHSLRGAWLCALVIAACGMLCFWLLASRSSPSYLLWGAAAVAALLVGAFATWAQAPHSPSTHPLNVQPPVIAAVDARPHSGAILFPEAASQFDAAAGQLIMSAGNVRIGCRPLLSFDRVSADGFWSIFAPAGTEQRRLISTSTRGTVKALRYSDNAIVTLGPPTPDRSLRLAAFTPLPHDAYSHLNTYSYFEIHGHKRLSLSFSPCPDVQINVLPADYPSGSPARFAYSDRLQNFRVVEASSGEKGPFQELALGRLERSEGLTIVIHDDGKPVAWIALEDWAQQLSSDLSPTAGWMVPVNAIEFQLLEDGPQAPAAIWVTLAGTSVGRGWETVGHRAGIYRNAIEFRTTAPRGANTKGASPVTSPTAPSTKDESILPER